MSKGAEASPVDVLIALDEKDAYRYRMAWHGTDHAMLALLDEIPDNEPFPYPSVGDVFMTHNASDHPKFREVMQHASTAQANGPRMRQAALPVSPAHELAIHTAMSDRRAMIKAGLFGQEDTYEQTILLLTEAADSALGIKRHRG